MRVTFIYPPISKVTTSIAPPVGLAYLASILIRKGANVNVISSDAEGLDVDATVFKALEAEPDIVGFSISTPTVNNALKVIKGIKKEKAGVMLFAGGPHPTLFPEEFLSEGVDFVVKGEGEETVSDLYDCWSGKKVVENIQGISYRQGDVTVENPKRALIDDLDTLPFPSWELFPIRNYRSDFRKNEFSLPVLSSRGCPAQCTFCYKGIFGDRFRVRKPACIVDEVVYLKESFKIEEFAIIDDSFTSNPQRAIEVCELLLERNIGLPWSLPAGIRVPTVSEELVEKLKLAGCYRVGLGVESGNQTIINSIKKGITLDQVRRAVRLLRAAGIESVAYFMIGNLEETEGTIDNTIAFAVGLDPDYAQFTKATPYPGTAMYKELKLKNRIITDNWDDFDSFLKSRPVFVHKNLSSERIDDKLREAYKKFYYRPRQIFRHLTAVHSPREAVNFAKNAIKFFTTYSA